MPIKVVVYILGLCGVINFSDNGRRGVDVLLPNTQFTPALGVPEHRAELAINRGAIVQSSPASTTEAPKQMNLAGHGVEIRCAGPQRGGRGLSIPSQDNGVPWRSVHWIADMAQFFTNSAPRTDLMQGDGGRVTAAMRLTDGTLTGARPTVPSSEFAIWQLGNQRQALTDRMMYTLNCPSGAVELRVSSFDGTETKVFSLTPTEGSEVVATVSNLPRPAPSADGSAHSATLSHLRVADQLMARRNSIPATGKLSSMTAGFDPSIVGTWDNPPECIPFVIHFTPTPPNPCIYCTKPSPVAAPQAGRR